MDCHAFCDRIGLAVPLLQAGLLDIAGPELAAAVSNAGAGGVLSITRANPLQIKRWMRKTSNRTARSFGVNLICDLSSADQQDAAVNAVLESAENPLFFTFYGTPVPMVVHTLRYAGVPFLIQVGSLEQALRAAAQQPLALIVQGTEAGGPHLGQQGLLELLALIHLRLPRMPLVAAGGLSDGAQLARLEGYGVAGLLCGTLFLATQESRAHPHYKARVIQARADDTLCTSHFELGWPGRKQRVIRTPSLELGHSLPKAYIGWHRRHDRDMLVPRFGAVVPTRETRGAIDEMALYCGIGCEAVAEEEAAERVVMRFYAQWKECRAGLAGLPGQMTLPLGEVQCP